MMYVREREEIEYDCNVWTCILQILMYTGRKGSIANSLHLPGSYRTFFIDILFGVSLTFSEQSWISSMVDFVNANELVSVSGGLGIISIIESDFLFSISLTTS